MWSNFVLTHFENLLYKLKDEVTAGADLRVQGRHVHAKIDKINF